MGQTLAERWVLREILLVQKDLYIEWRGFESRGRLLSDYSNSQIHGASMHANLQP